MSEQSTIKKIHLSCSHTEMLASSYIDGDLSEEHSAMLESHMKCCKSCDEVVQDLFRLKRLTRELANQPVPEDISARLREKMKKFSQETVYVRARG